MNLWLIKADLMEKNWFMNTDSFTIETAGQPAILRVWCHNPLETLQKLVSTFSSVGYDRLLKILKGSGVPVTMAVDFFTKTTIDSHYSKLNYGLKFGN